jgi:hypothetical protein
MVRERKHGRRWIGSSTAFRGRSSPGTGCYAIFSSFQHLSQSHIMPRTLPLAVIILAACMGLPQHWGLVFTMAFFEAAFAVLLNSAIFFSLRDRFPENAGTSRFSPRNCILTIGREKSSRFSLRHGRMPYRKVRKVFRPHPGPGPSCRAGLPSANRVVPSPWFLIDSPSAYLV